MGLFGKKNGEKGVPFWKRKKQTEEEAQQAESLHELVETPADEPDEFEEIAASTIAERAALEQDEIERARQVALEVVQEEAQRQEAIALARQAAMAASGEAEETSDLTDESSAEVMEEAETSEEAADFETSSEDEDLTAPEAAAEVPTEPTVSEMLEEAADTEEAAEALTAETLETAESAQEALPEEVQVEAPAEVLEKKGLFAKIRAGLRKTKDAMVAQMQKVLGSFTKIDEDLFEELEETMIMSDLGPETSVQICDTLRNRVKERGVTDPNAIMGMIQEIITEMLGEDQILTYPTTPTVVMVIGVNGAGKTTTIGKLCHQLRQEGKKVLVAAADTFRAAAIDQLEVWTQRAGVELVKHAEGSDPASVVYDAIDAAKARGCDVLICDTAGRLHNKKNLMQELAKINRIIETRAAGCHREILLVLDATTGQNAVNQARLFQEVADITGIVLTKLDGTAKGGIIVSIRHELGIPVKLIGVGEKIDDLQPFHGADFVRALFEPTEEA